MNRYNVYVNQRQGNGCELAIVEEPSGEWVKFKEIRPAKYCKWEWIEFWPTGIRAEFWRSECGNPFDLFSAGEVPGDGGFIYCPYCGGRLVKEY